MLYVCEASLTINATLRCLPYDTRRSSTGSAKLLTETQHRKITFEGRLWENTAANDYIHEGTIESEQAEG